MIPGEVLLAASDIVINEGRNTVKLIVINKGGRPIQVGSHFHFFESNKLLSFDRSLAYGMRLNIPSGTAVRFEPNEPKEISLVTIGGKRKVIGGNNLVDGFLDEKKKSAQEKLACFLKEDK